MDNRKLLDTYIVCGAINKNAIDTNKYNLDKILKSDISIKEFLDLYIMDKNSDILNRLIRVGDIIVDKWGDDRRYCEERIQDIGDTYKLCLKMIGNFRLLPQIERLRNELFTSLLCKHSNKEEYKGKFKIITSNMLKLQLINLDNPIIIDKKKYSIIEKIAKHPEQRVFTLCGYRNDSISILVVRDNGIEFIKEMNTQERKIKLKELRKDKSVQLIITLTNAYEDSWIYMEN